MTGEGGGGEDDREGGEMIGKGVEGEGGGVWPEGGDKVFFDNVIILRPRTKKSYFLVMDDLAVPTLLEGGGRLTGRDDWDEVNDCSIRKRLQK